MLTARRVDAHAHRDHRGLHLLDDVGKADRALRGLRLLRQVLRLRGRREIRTHRDVGREEHSGGAEAGDRGGEKGEAAGGETPRGFEW